MKKLKKYLPLVPAVLIVVLIIAGIGVWRDYRDTLMKNQEDQLLIVTRILRDRPCGTSYDGTSGRLR